MRNKHNKIYLYSRQRLLLALIQAFGGRLSPIDLQKYLFLFTELYQEAKSYEFVPYKYGCFSFQCYADRRKLEELGLLKSINDWEISDNTDYLRTLDMSTRKALERFADTYKDISGNSLIKEVYRRFPYYAINSKIAVDLMNDDELKRIEEARPTSETFAFFTIGYEGKSFENYLNRLIRNNIRVLCDVRKNPLSRKYGFSKSTLSETLQKLGIGYVHIPELGIVSDKRKSLTCQADYDRLFAEYERSTLQANSDAVERLYNIFQRNKRVAITCFEANHCMCHRSRVAKALSQRPDWNYGITHI